MNKLPKYILIAFISFNVLGGSILGIYEYKEEKDTQKMFTSFYNTDTQVLGAYDNKKTDGQVANIMLYILGGVFIFALSFGVGATATYFVMRRKKGNFNKSVKNL